MQKIIILLLVIVLGLSVYGNFNQMSTNSELQEKVNEINAKNSDLTNQLDTLATKTSNLENKISTPMMNSTISMLENNVTSKTHTQSITAVAVRPVLNREGYFQNVQYEGTVMHIQVSTHQGSGLVLINTAIPTGVDFQSSAKIAVNVAEKYLKIDLSNTDIIFSITADKDENLQAVDGQSAGAAMTVLLISSLQDKILKDDVIMTGTINPDMSIGKVGGVSQKADAAGKYGATTFLVPSTQGVTYVEKCDENKVGNFVYRSCSSEQKSLSPVTEEKYGMKTIEVGNIKEALLYFQ